MYLGGEEWVQGVRQKLELKPRSDAHPRMQRIVGRPTMTQIVTAVVDALRVPESSIRSARGGAPRRLSAWIGCHEGMLTNAEIAAGLRMRSSGHVSDLIRQCEREIAVSEEVRAAIDRCIATLRRISGLTKL
jgi:hypothetical protein